MFEEKFHARAKDSMKLDVCCLLFFIEISIYISCESVWALTSFGVRMEGVMKEKCEEHFEKRAFLSLTSSSRALNGKFFFILIRIQLW